MASSQSSFDGRSTPFETPATPQPLNASLPDSRYFPGVMSPSTSMAAAGGSETDEKLESRSSISASITPPPSTQAPDPRFPIDTRRTTTASALSSPPPTIPNGVKRGMPNGTSFSRPNLDLLGDANETELRDMVKALVAENEKLELSVSEGRITVAHHMFQYNLLSIEAAESAKRMEVEHEMTRREVAVLQYANQGRDTTPAGQEYVARLKAFAQSMEQDNIALDKKLQRAKKMIELQHEELQEFKDDKARLLQRIRENREHMNIHRSPGGIFHAATPKSQRSYPATPQQYRNTPKHAPMTGRSVNKERSGEPFAALLLAGNVLSQENNSAPSTPMINRRSDPRTPVNRHNRGVQSLSSLPTTPGSGRPDTANSTLLPSVQFTPRNGSRTANQTPLNQSRDRRRKSRDSTISASDAEEIARAVMESYREESEEVQESQASQSAAEMLRIDPRESFEVAASRTNTPTPAADKSNLHQSKIFGSVSKPVAEKRKRLPDSYNDGFAAKKARSAVEGVGLGIGM